MTVLRLLAVAVVAGAALCAQQTIIVQGGGQAYDQALLAANHGDTLIVRAGRYQSSTATKGVTVLCDPGVEFGLGLGWFPIGATNLPAGTNFVFRGGRIAFQMNFSDVAVTNCAGNVVFEGLVDDDGLGISISNCASVAFHRCRFDKATIRDSSLALSECTISGSWAVPSLELIDSEVAIAGGSIRGKDGFQSLFPPQPGIGLFGGTLTIAGDANTVITAGNGVGFPPPPAITASVGELRIDPAVQLVSSAPSAIAGGATVRVLPIPSVAASPVASGRPFTASVHAEVGSDTWLLASWLVAPVAFPFGTLWVSPAGPMVDRGIVPPGGYRSWSIVVPALPRGTAVVFQPISVRTTGELVIGTPTVVVFD